MKTEGESLPLMAKTVITSLEEQFPISFDLLPSGHAWGADTELNIYISQDGVFLEINGLDSMGSSLQYCYQPLKAIIEALE